MTKKGIAVDPAKPGLEGRKALCTQCEAVTDSSWRLAFFQYRGPGSYSATQCKHCLLYRNDRTHDDEGWCQGWSATCNRCGHTKGSHRLPEYCSWVGLENSYIRCKCPGWLPARFEPIGDRPDLYYCGCHGWD